MRFEVINIEGDDLMANCPLCNIEVPAGSRWCGMCHTYITNPKVGQLASPGKRLGAYILDLMPLLVFLIVSKEFNSLLRHLRTGEGVGGWIHNDQVGVGFVIVFLLLVGFVVSVFIPFFIKASTPGKWLLGMRVIREDGRNANFLIMIIRELIGKFISGMLLLLGFVWILFDRENQGWHDKLLRTYVVDKARGAQAGPTGT